MAKAVEVKPKEEVKEVYVNVLKKGLYNHDKKEDYPFGSHILADKRLAELAKNKTTDDDSKLLVSFEKKRKVA